MEERNLLLIDLKISGYNRSRRCETADTDGISVSEEVK